METPSRVANWSLRLALCGLLLFALGPAAVQLEVLAPFVGFRVFVLGFLLALLALGLGLVGLWRTRPASGREGRGRAGAGAGLGALLIGLVLVSNAGALGLPPINDITTDPEDPPNFVAIAELEPNRDRDLTYPGAKFASRQRAAYPDLAPLQVDRDPGMALEQATDVARALGWEIVEVDPQDGRLEAVQVSTVFRFVDDIVVRVRPGSQGAIVDVRSKSRDGRGDLGANADRIRAFRDALVP